MINILILAIIFGYGGFVLYRMHKKKKEGAGAAVAAAAETAPDAEACRRKNNHRQRQKMCGYITPAHLFFSGYRYCNRRREGRRQP